MNDRQLDKKVQQDTVKVKKALNALVKDSAARISRFEGKASQVTGKAKEDLTTWVEDSVSQFSGEFEKLTGDVRKTLAGAAKKVTKDVGHGLSQYNAKAQGVADKVPGDFSEKAAKYPWVVISIALAAGFLLGGFLKPTRRPVW